MRVCVLRTCVRTCVRACVCVCVCVRVPFSPEILQAGAVLGSEGVKADS